MSHEFIKKAQNCYKTEKKNTFELVSTFMNKNNQDFLTALSEDLNFVQSKEKVCSQVSLISREYQLEIVISMFLFFCQISGSCSYKIVLMKKRVHSGNLQWEDFLTPIRIYTNFWFKIAQKQNPNNICIFQMCNNKIAWQKQ